MIDVDLFLQFDKDLPWQPNNLQESNEDGLIPPVFFALAFENELEYQYLYARIYMRDDQATSYINLVGFWPVAYL